MADLQNQRNYSTTVFINSMLFFFGVFFWLSFILKHMQLIFSAKSFFKYITTLQGLLNDQGNNLKIYIKNG